MSMEANIDKAQALRALAKTVPVGASFRERRLLRAKLTMAFRRTVVPYKKLLGSCVPMTEPLGQDHLEKLEKILEAVAFSNEHNLIDVEYECMVHIY